MPEIKPKFFKFILLLAVILLTFFVTFFLIIKQQSDSIDRVTGEQSKDWTPEQAAQKAVSDFEKIQKGRVDGCGFSCKDCGVKSIETKEDNYVVMLEYACGLLPADEKKYHKIQEIIVSKRGE